MLLQSSPPAQGQVTVSNTGQGTLQFSAQATTSDGSWLTLGNNSGAATPQAPATLNFTVSPAGLAAGQHSGNITVTDTGSGIQAVVNVSLLVNVVQQQAIQLSQTGMTFTAVANGTKPLGQTFTVFNLGQGSMDWTASAQTIPPGQTWLR